MARKPKGYDPDAIVYDVEDAPPETSRLGSVVKMAHRLLMAEREVAMITRELKRASEEMDNISDCFLPELMQDARITTFTMDNGYTVAVKNVVRASIPKDNLAEGLAWLIDNGHGDLIKEEISLAFGRGDNEFVIKFLPWLRRFMARCGKSEVPVSDDMKVHAGTLSAFVKEQLNLEPPAELPEAILGIFRQTLATMTPPKEAKKKGGAF